MRGQQNRRYQQHNSKVVNFCLRPPEIKSIFLASAELLHSYTNRNGTCDVYCLEVDGVKEYVQVHQNRSNMRLVRNCQGLTHEH